MSVCNLLIGEPVLWFSNGKQSVLSTQVCFIEFNDTTNRASRRGLVSRKFYQMMTQIMFDQFTLAILRTYRRFGKIVRLPDRLKQSLVARNITNAS